MKGLNPSRELYIVSYRLYAQDNTPRYVFETLEEAKSFCAYVRALAQELETGFAHSPDIIKDQVFSFKQP